MSIPWPDFALLDEAGLGLHEKRALVTLSQQGVAEAATLSRLGDIPTSKLYGAMEKLAALGLVEIQRGRPKRYIAFSPDLIVDRLVQLARTRAETFAAQSDQLRQAFAGLPSQLESRLSFADVAMGMEAHVKRHLTRLSCAEREVISYMERGDIEAVQQFAHGGFHVLKSMAQATAQRGLRHRVIFGFSDRNAPGLLAFLKAQAQHLQRAGLCRFTGEMGHPFHVMDGETVILGLDHPFVPEGRFASLLIRDEVLAGKLTEGFKGLWDRAMEDMGEIRHWPGALRDRA